MMKRIILCIIVLCALALLAFAYQGLMPTENLIPELSHAKKLTLNGKWKITAYCPGACCNSKHTLSGIIDYSDSAAIGGVSLTGMLKKGIAVVAVDPTIIPLGSAVNINGTMYMALDTGGAIEGVYTGYISAITQRGS